ncbi:MULTISPECIES: heavy metal sensor histidine kinase [Achromobacter]|uniref:Sensor protein n=1 Tax=Alcaligenes xylosoxydans xylosoxydans TaxID=85698 RepID=A0A424WJZ3_ALCXX|nr:MULTISPECIES: heavy metal sensor histidine kinase [Achromobacter]MBC9904029.1 heavy metal sensor histidine kinase [Achromobacter xylosoxidans]MBD0868012.1 heavy metal sensor histidine kinase [Achromobacter xylosoxidans]MDH1301701.1 heavy metal sensor histidine kinase [Achromobacter sp. GD03932]QNP86669.1 heavy metal sensor histidine kinase [Achromobacter xylosoxidans]RPJ93613.1 HAMP domain-containing protein [Achromobacter xylosoxidans]
MKLPRIASMEIRLTLLLGVIALVVSSVAGYTLFWALKREVQRQEITEVAGKLELINHLIGMQATLAQMQDLRGALDNIMVGHGNLKTWITLADGSVFYGDAPPVDVRPLSGREIRLHSQDGWNMRGLRVPLEGTLLPGAELTVAVNLRPGTQFLYAFATALVLICAIWVGATLVLSAWAVRRSLSPIRRLSQQAARIQPDNLAVRLPEQGIDRELREFTHTFNGMLGRVQTAYQQMEGFNADVAHELRTPLATLISGAEVILSSPRSEQELREVLESNLEELEGLKALVNDMLFLARADGGEPAGDLQEVDVRREVARVAEYYEAALDEAGVSLTAHGAATLMANPRLLRRAIANLLSNAIRATPHGRGIDLYCITRQDEIEIRVRNPGAPIAAEALPRIFDRFYRGDDARSRRADGHGLGLAIVRAIARMHGGNAFARCGGQGTEVGFTLSRTPNITGK